MTAVDDLAAWLTQIWDERERMVYDRRATVHAMTCDGFPSDETDSGYAEAGEVDNCTCGGATLALARIAADRQILARCRRMIEHAKRPDREGCWKMIADFAWATLDDLALPYADRPGYRDDWRSASPSQPESEPLP